MDTLRFILLSDKHESPYEVSFGSCEELSFSKGTSSHQNARLRSGTIGNIMLVQRNQGHRERIAIREVSGQAREAAGPMNSKFVLK
jgi:hypothetical protein